MIDNAGDLAEIIANTDPDALRLQELSTEIHTILAKRGWPGVVIILAKSTPDSINQIASRYLNMGDMNQIAMLASSECGSTLVQAIIDLEN